MDYKWEIAEALGKASGLPAQQLADMLETPPDASMGDFALPCFRLAKALRKAPPAIADELCARLEKPACVERVEPVKGYLNFYLDRSDFTRRVLQAVETGEAYGSSREGKGKTICIDYSSINIAKPFGIHHLPSTAIGNSLGLIYRYLGYRTVSMNFLGDWGTQFGRMIVAYRKWGDSDRVQREGVKALVDLYVRFHDELDAHPELGDEGRAWFKKIEDGDPEALDLFNWFKDITLSEVARVYDKLGVRFDEYQGESFYADKTDPVLAELREKQLLSQSDGAQVVYLDDYDMPPCLFVRSDGATLYVTRDIAAAFWRKEHYQFEKCLYVVAYQQNLHFKQWFQVVQLMGREWAQDLVHVAFGMVSMEDGAMSTRKGRVVLMEDVLDRAVEKVQEIIREKSPGLENQEQVAQQVGIGAVLFSVLYNNRIKDTVFSWDNVLNFDGETAPYAQYTHARCSSVLRKAGDFPLEGEWDEAALNLPEAQAVLKEIAAFPDAVAQAARRYEPYLVARKVIDVCKAFNKFYYEQRILDCPDAEKRAKLRLTRAAMATIRQGLYLLGIQAPHRM
ncbi:MAG: arginine--tRNA ligase [Eubacteriales bacterium]|nr:arginine--tRNA ligase [Eubacteriales bacterium]